MVCGTLLFYICFIIIIIIIIAVERQILVFFSVLTTLVLKQEHHMHDLIVANIFNLLMVWICYTNSLNTSQSNASLLQSLLDFLLV